MIKISEILEFLPKKLILTLLLILVLIYGISFALSYFIDLNLKKISELNNNINNFVSEYQNTLKQDQYRAILQFLTIEYLINNKKFVSNILTNLPKYLPKNYQISEFSFDDKENKIKLSGTLPNWIEYAKVYKYFTKNTELFPNFKVENLGFDKEKSIVNLSISFSVNYSILNQ